MQNLPRQHVASGSWVVGKTQPLVLQAFLGTCVGVAVYDGVAGIGGLTHILLPEPVSPFNVAQPEKYASTGLPLFLEALFAEGADAKNLKACIAGGALVGPLNQQDFSLDIGGRSAEVAAEILSQNGIEIVKSETAGFFTCSLSLNMKNWETAIEPAGFEKFNEGGEIVVPTPEQIQSAIEALQPIPQVALKILRIMGDDDYDIGHIADEVRQDQVIGARTLQLCNSALFARLKKVASLEDAIVLLGRDLLVKLVVSASVKSIFENYNQGYSLCKGGLYHHAVGTAIISEQLAQITGKAIPAMAYTAGLLHDIGKVVLDQYIGSAYPYFYRKLQEEETSFLDMERRILAVDHAEVGERLARKWSFPDSLTHTIRSHHHPEAQSDDAAVAHIVYLADLLMSRFHAGLEVERMETQGLEQRLKDIGLTLDRFPEVVEKIPAQVFESIETAFL